MSTNAQRKANRKNSQHSTGPTSAAGKATSSQNSLRHGLASSQLLIPGESEAEFNSLLTGLLAEHQPTTLTETLLVQDMAKHHWLTDRALRLQSEALSTLNPPLPTLALLIRYQTANERAFQKAFATLNAMRKAAKSEIGSASKSAQQAEAAEAKAAYDEWHARFLDYIKPPLSIEQMIAQGFHQNPETGNWEKVVCA